MLRFILVVCLTAFVATAQVFAQQPMEDVIHLKNGRIVRGTISERIPGESLKIQTPDGNVFVYAMDEVAKTSKEPVKESGRHIGARPLIKEVGTLFGVSHSRAADENLATISVPGSPLGAIASISFLPVLYVSWFPSEQVSIGPEVNFGTVSSDESILATLSFGGQATFFFQSNSMSGSYITGRASLLVSTSVWTDSGTDYAIGGGLGHQWRIGPAFVLRMEGVYQRWFDAEINNVLFILGLGTRFGG